MHKTLLNKENKLEVTPLDFSDILYNTLDSEGNQLDSNTGTPVLKLQILPYCH